jgi:RHS repeat-associated protein
VRAAARLATALAILLATAVSASAQGETVEYYGLDALGSVRVVFDATGNIVGRMDYGPFGQELFGGSSMPDRRYAGLFRDGEAGLDAAGARSYQSRTGRFTTVDPIYAGLFEPQRWNRYAYARNNPLLFIDPSGMDECNPPRPNCYATSTTGKTEREASSDAMSFVFGGLLGGLFDWGWGAWLSPISLPTGDAPDLGGAGNGTSTGSPGTNPGPATGPGTGPGPGPTLPGGDNAQQPCAASAGTTSIVNANATTNIPTIAAGVVVGGAIGGPVGVFVGGMIGSLLGVGGTVSYVPSTKSLYAGPTLVVAPALGGGSGFSGNAVSVPAGQNPNSIANGLSYSVTFQANPLLGSTVVKSPGNGPPVLGPSVGTRIPVSFGVSYNFPVKKGGC